MSFNSPICHVGAECVNQAGAEPVRVNRPPRTFASRPNYCQAGEEYHLLGQIENVERVLVSSLVSVRILRRDDCKQIQVEPPDQE